MSPPHHLVVFVHGFSGSWSDFNSMESQFLAHHQAEQGGGTERLLTLKITCNSTLAKTLDGIENGAVRIWKEIMQFITGLDIRAISFISHSLGGLYSRYVCRLLDECEFFTRVEPRFFVTMASPHLSVRRAPGSLFTSPFNLAFQGVAQTVCRSTRELCLEDASRLLHGMTEPHYLAALEKFKRRILYANVLNDFQVHYSTASISLRSPYARSEYLSTSAQFPSITSWSLANVQRRLKHDDGLPFPRLAFAHDAKGALLREMFERLNSLAWERYDCVFNTVLAHEQIVNKRPMFAGRDVVQHLLREVMFS